jgi:hypothetical protein
MNTLTSCFALAPPNAKTYIFFFVIIRSLGNEKTATETLLHDVGIRTYDLNYVDKAGMETPHSKTDVLITIGVTWGEGKMPSQYFFYLRVGFFGN